MFTLLAYFRMTMCDCAPSRKVSIHASKPQLIPSPLLPKFVGCQAEPSVAFSASGAAVGNFAESAVLKAFALQLSAALSQL